MSRPPAIDTTLANVDHVLYSLMHGEQVLFSSILTDKTMDEIKRVIQCAAFIVIGPSCSDEYAIIAYTNDTLFFCDITTMELVEFKTVGVYCNGSSSMSDTMRSVYDNVVRLKNGDVNGFFIDESYSEMDIVKISDQIQRSSVKIMQPVVCPPGYGCTVFAIEKNNNSCVLVDMNDECIEVLPVHSFYNNVNKVVARVQKPPNPQHFSF